MKFAPIPTNILTTPVIVTIESGQDVYGGSTELTVTGMCRLVEKSKQVLDADRRLIVLAGWIYLSGDIAPELNVIESGKVTIGTSSWRIHSAERLRNPDSSVHHTKLFLR